MRDDTTRDELDKLSAERHAAVLNRDDCLEKAAAFSREAAAFQKRIYEIDRAVAAHFAKVQEADDAALKLAADIYDGMLS